MALFQAVGGPENRVLSKFKAHGQGCSAEDGWTFFFSDGGGRQWLKKLNTEATLPG